MSLALLRSVDCGPSEILQSLGAVLGRLGLRLVRLLLVLRVCHRCHLLSVDALWSRRPDFQLPLLGPSVERVGVHSLTNSVALVTLGPKGSCRCCDSASDESPALLTRRLTGGSSPQRRHPRPKDTRWRTRDSSHTTSRFRAQEQRAPARCFFTPELSNGAVAFQLVTNCSQVEHPLDASSPCSR